MSAYKCCDLEDLKAFIDCAAPKSVFTYYEGLSLTDTVLSNQIRKIVYEYAVQGRIYLVQRKSFPGYKFQAIKASQLPIIKLVPLSEHALTERAKKRKYHGFERVDEIHA